LPFHFGDFVLDPGRRELRSGSKVFAVEPQVFDVLEFLIRNRARVVSKDDLLATVWGGRIVSDSAIAARINAARQAVGDDGREQRFIRTIPRKGFRFVGEVREEEAAAMTSLPPPPQRPRAANEQRITFCRTSDGINIAVARVGRGKPLVCTPILGAHVEYDWENPTRADLWQFLADRFELIRYDGRGTGLSDRNVTELSFETFQRDLDTVVEALGLQQYAFFGIGAGNSVAPAIAHAAKHPDRVSKLVIHGGLARGAQGGNAWWTPFVWMITNDWGFGSLAYVRSFLAEILPGLSPEQLKACVDLLPKTTSLETALRHLAAATSVDVAGLLPQVRASTLVLHCRDCRQQNVSRAQGTATSIPNARLVSLATDNDIPLPGEPAWPVFLRALETFLSED
jgi:DNA-binding winged helix-turn-helix (wHTH) protein/pimeloyl-ACP methyl ester carboxylesterase